MSSAACCSLASQTTPTDRAWSVDRTAPDEIMAQAGEAKQTATRCLKLEGASLSVGVMCTFAPVQFVSFLGRFRADTPGIEITLLEDVPDRLCNLLADGEMDMAL